MTIPSSFPFGQPVQPVSSGPPGNRDCLVIGSLPAALCIRWRVPGGKLVQGFVVDNEPTPFWNGHDQDGRVRTWKQAVMWQDSWGEVATTRMNGHHGQWLDAQVLSPLHIARTSICATTLMETFHANEATRHRIDEHYRPLIERLGLRPCTLANQPGTSDLVREAVTTERARLLGLIQAPSVQTVITLGTAASKALIELLVPAGAQTLTSRLGDGPEYGQPQSIELTGRTLRWHAFFSPDAPASVLRVHAGWIERMGIKPLAKVGAFK